MARTACRQGELGRVACAGLGGGKLRPAAPGMRPSSAAALLTDERRSGLPRYCLARGLDFGQIYQDPLAGALSGEGGGRRGKGVC